jgi:hypothetical protein
VQSCTKNLSMFRPVLFLLSKDPVLDNSPHISVRTGPDG